MTEAAVPRTRYPRASILIIAAAFLGFGGYIGWEYYKTRYEPLPDVEADPSAASPRPVDMNPKAGGGGGGGMKGGGGGGMKGGGRGEKGRGGAPKKASPLAGGGGAGGSTASNGVPPGKSIAPAAGYPGRDDFKKDGGKSEDSKSEGEKKPAEPPKAPAGDQKSK